MKRFKNILYFADGAMKSCPALERAVGLAGTKQARLTAMDVLDETESSPEIEGRLGMDLNQVLRDRRLEVLDDLVAPFNLETAVDRFV